MILGNPEAAERQPSRDQIAIDELFGGAARRQPDRLAIADAPNRETFTDGAPRRLSHAQADRMVDAIAARLRQMNLPTDSIVGIQLPNIVEHVLVLLGVMRAGLIAAPLPLLWRRADAIAALARIGAKAMVTCRRVGVFNHGQFALRVAVEVFSIRYVCGFGANLPDGMVSFDDLFAAPNGDALPPFDRERPGNSAARVAVITFDVGEGGILPVARTHLELLAGGLNVLLESRLAPGSVILSTVAPSSFAGICLTLLPWMFSGGTLLLHHPFNSNILGRQWRDDRFDALILPGTVAFPLADSGAFARKGPNCIIAPWRSPELLPASPIWRQRDVNLVDVAIFGEVGLVAGRRGDDGKPAAIPLGPIVTPRPDAGMSAVRLAELARSQTGTVALRGPMVPHHSYPPGRERSGLPQLKIGSGGFIDTGYSCRIDDATGAVVVTGPPMATVGVGGYRFPLPDLRDVIGRVEAGATLAAVSDSLLGQRLVGRAADHATIRAALKAVGINPLVVAAFADGGDSSRSEAAVAA